MISFTAGVMTAATLFAYSSRIPIPIKVAPTRGADDLLSRPQDSEGGVDLQFQQRLQERVLSTETTTEKTPVSVPAPKLPTTKATPELKPVVAEVKPATAAEIEPQLAHYVQAGAYTDVAAATKLRDTLAGQGLPALVRSDDNLYRVVIGPYPEVGGAEEVRAQLALQGRSTQVLRLPAANP